MGFTGRTGPLVCNHSIGSVCPFTGFLISLITLGPFQGNPGSTGLKGESGDPGPQVKTPAWMLLRTV